MSNERDRALTFDRVEGDIRHRFLRHGPVAAHVALTSGATPRIVVAFPAGNRGVLLSGTTHDGRVALDFGGPIVALEPETDGIRGVLVPIIADALAVRFTHAVLGNIRTIRDVGYGALPSARLSRYAKVVTGPAHDRALAIERGDLDERHVHALAIEPRDGSDVAVEPDGTIILQAGPDRTVRADLIATCDATPLTPIPSRNLLRGRAVAGSNDAFATAGTARDLDSLAFLSYREKLLAGSWQYLTYFGRDTLLSLRLLAPVASADLFEAGLGAVLDRLAPDGTVAHEETLGEYALLERERRSRHARRRAGHSGADPVRRWGGGRAAAVLDDKMVDDDFLLAPVLLTYLLDIAAADRAMTFLNTGGGRFLDAVRANLTMVTDRARPYAASSSAADLIRLRPGIPVGTWRDSAEGLGGGRVPYDVNVALVPAALDAAARLWASGPIGPDSERAADARALAAAWGTTARHFAVEIDGETARERLAAFIADRGLPGGDNAAQAIGDVIRFPAIALDAELNPIPVMHGDDCLAMLFTNPAASALDGMAQRIADPFPAGLRVPNAGIVVANPAFAPANVQGLFTAGHYHGTVAWSWPHAAYAAGLDRQLARTDLPPSTRARLEAARTWLWAGIDATEPLRGTEFWTIAVRDGRYFAVPAQGAGIVNESNPVQLWSTVWLGIARPPGVAKPS